MKIKYPGQRLSRYCQPPAAYVLTTMGFLLSSVAAALTCFSLAVYASSYNDISSSIQDLSEKDDEEETDYIRLHTNSLVLIHLEDRIKALKKKLDTLSQSHQRVDEIYRNVKWRLARLEGSFCAENQFQCGSNRYECISDILVCDGVKDCHNGYDESATTCDTSRVKAGLGVRGCPAAGALFGTGMIWMCFSGKINSVHRSKILPGRLSMTGYVVSHFESHAKQPLGVQYRLIAYHAGMRTWIFVEYAGLSHQDLPRAVVSCFVTDEHFKEMVCSAATEGSGHVKVRNVINYFEPPEALCPVKNYSDFSLV